MASKKIQNQKLLVVNAHHLRRLDSNLPEKLDPVVMGELNVQLALWLPGWLDELSDELYDVKEKKIDSPNREKAVSRCLTAIEETTGLKFPEPKIISTEGLAMNELTQGSKTVTPKKPAAKAATQAKKTAPKAPAKAAAKKNGAAHVTSVKVVPHKATGKAPAKASPKDGEFEKQSLTLVQKENPKRPGTDAHKRYGYYATSKTVGDFLRKGGTALDIRYDKKSGFIRLGKAK